MAIQAMYQNLWKRVHIVQCVFVNPLFEYPNNLGNLLIIFINFRSHPSRFFLMAITLVNMLKVKHNIRKKLQVGFCKFRKLGLVIPLLKCSMTLLGSMLRAKKKYKIK